MINLLIHRKPSSNLTFCSNALFSRSFPPEEIEFIVPEPYFAYLQRDFNVIEVLPDNDVPATNVQAPCWYNKLTLT